jgi:prepilin-type N-terminal cleavage/methylation domain-containing protein
MKKGFTLLEISIVILIFSLIMVALASIYTSLMRALIIADHLQASLENVRYASEKIFRIVKYGWDFSINSPNSISFYDRSCDSIFEIKFQNENLILEKKDPNSGNVLESGELFDPSLVRLKRFEIIRDLPNTNETFFYFQYAPKVIVFFYDFELITKAGTSSLAFEQAIAPLNSVMNISLCQR